MAEQKTANVKKDGPAQVSELGVAGKTPIGRQSAITVADGSTGGNQTSINEIITVLEDFGLVTAN